MGMNVEVKKALGTFKQTFSHLKLTLHVYHCLAVDGKGEGKWIPVRNLHLLPMSKIHRRIANLISDRRFQIEVDSFNSQFEI